MPNENNFNDVRVRITIVRTPRDKIKNKKNLAVIGNDVSRGVDREDCIHVGDR